MIFIDPMKSNSPVKRTNLPQKLQIFYLTPLISKVF